MILNLNNISNTIAAPKQNTNQPKALLKTEVAREITSLSKTSNDADFIKSPNIIKIIKDVKTAKSGYYIALAAYSKASNKDSFLNELKAAGLINIGFFFDSKSEKYFIYQNKPFNDLEAAKKALQISNDSSYKGKKAIVKLEN